MAIEIVTGIPGNGKTLHTISRLLAKSAAENRPVYYANVPGLNIPAWTELEDATKWAEVPPNSIVFIDEAQKTFRNRSLGAVPPKHVTDLETHRHLGIDLYLISQHPSLLDPAIRRLAQTHYHLVRIWGMEASTVHKWNGVKDNCDKSRADSESSKWSFDKKVYTLYKSAEVHTMKRSIPTRVKLLLIAPVLLVLAGYGVYRMVIKKPQIAPQAVSSGGPVRSGQPGAPAPQGAARPFDPIADARQYLDTNTPRIVGLPHTAPKYDEITRPVRAPVPAACIQHHLTQCKCFTQQGTPMDVELNQCITIARNGWFQDFDADHGTKDQQRTERGQAVLAGNVPEASLPSHAGGSAPPPPAPRFVNAFGGRSGEGVTAAATTRSPDPASNV